MTIPEQTVENTHTHYLSLSGAGPTAAHLIPHLATTLRWDLSLSEPIVDDICQHM